MESYTTLTGSSEVGTVHGDGPASDHDVENTVRRPIRFGVICPGTVARQWQAEALRQLLALEGARAAVRITDCAHPAVDAASAVENPAFPRLLAPRPAPLAGTPRAMRPVDLAELLAFVPHLRCPGLRLDASVRSFGDDDVRAIRDSDLDFILYLGSDALRGGILTAARHGVWSFVYTDGTTYRREPPTWWSARGASVTGAALMRQTERADAGIVLRQGFAESADRSSRRSFDTIFFESARWPAQVCAELLAGRAEYVDAEPVPMAAHMGGARGPFDTLQSAGVVLWLRGREIVRKHARCDHWRVGLIDAPIQALLTPGRVPPVRWLDGLTNAEFLADPFGVVHDGRLTLLCEHFDYRTARGTITSIERDETGAMRRQQVAIGPDVHLSYPYLLEHEGAVFCIPETHEAREIALYRADPFPRRWVKVATLVSGFAGVDATVFHYDGRWWLACTDDERGPNRNLHLWYATDLLGPWRPHAGNPVKTDVRSARPAGTPFLHEGRLYRPAQDCSRVYGGRVVINRVSRLTPYEFREEPTAIIGPSVLDGAPDGIHTISAVGSRTLVDAKWSVFRPRVVTRAVIESLTGRRPRPSSHSALWTPDDDDGPVPARASRIEAEPRAPVGAHERGE